MDALIARIARRCAVAMAALAWQTAFSQTLFWSSPPNAVNLTAAGQPMDGGFRFELGVFAGSFTPTSGNLAQWSANWRPLQRVAYNAATKRYAGEHVPPHNNSPFAIGKPVYVWGFKGDAMAGEWILFRANSWLYPDANPLIPPPPNAYEWFANASGVTAVIGTIQSSGNPSLMRSAGVSGVMPPTTTWDQWQAETLAGETLDQPEDDPDNDRLKNLLEFVFGFDPKQPNPSPPMTLSLEEAAGQKYLQLHVLRRKDHLATINAQVSSDLVVWQQGGTYLQVVEDGPAVFIVRDLTPYPSSGGRRFLRLGANLPTP